MKYAIVAAFAGLAAAGVYEQPPSYGQTSEAPKPYAYNTPVQYSPTPYETPSTSEEATQPAPSTYEKPSTYEAPTSAPAPYHTYAPAPNSTYAAPSYTTEVVTKLVTYCPSATKITHGGSTYTVTEPTTLTITNCPCTISKPVYTSVTSVCYTCSESSAPVYTTPAAPVSPSGAPTYPAGNSTAPTYASPSASYSAAPSQFTGAAANVVAQTGAGLAALLGAVAYIL